MKYFAHFWLAVSLLLVQIGPSKLICACPEKAAPNPVVANAAVCPMSGKVGCRCCEGSSISQSSKKWAAISGANTKCIVAVGSDSKIEAVKSVFESTDCTVICTETTSLPSIDSKRIHHRPIALIVPRIRLPDCSFHGLRAPPAC